MSNNLLNDPYTFVIGMGDAFICQIPEKCSKIVKCSSCYNISTFSRVNNLLKEAAAFG